jgi:hypothetical protein
MQRRVRLEESGRKVRRAWPFMKVFIISSEMLSPGSSDVRVSEVIESPGDVATEARRPRRSVLTPAPPDDAIG